jgi:hypothetical protein
MFQFRKLLLEFLFQLLNYKILNLKIDLLFKKLLLEFFF